MNGINLEKYKRAWKNERSFYEKSLSENQISKFMQSSSKSVVMLFRKGLLFDIFFKIALIVSLVLLFFLLQGQNTWKLIVVFQALLVLAGIFRQKYILQKIPARLENAQNALYKLHEYIDFYYRYYINSIYIGALSVTFFFLTGSIYYLHFKYLEIPRFQIDDFIVFGIGSVLCFGLSAFSQLHQNKFHINQLEDSLKELEENTITEQYIEALKNRKIRNHILIGLIFILGLLLFFYLIFSKS